MTKKNPSWSEQLVGRPCPKDAPYIDQIMAGYVKEDGSFCGRMEPLDRWLRPAFTKMKRKGLVAASILSFGKGATIFFLTERGEPEAVAARQRVIAAREARHQWGKDFNEAYRKSQAEAA